MYLRAGMPSVRGRDVDIAPCATLFSRLPRSAKGRRFESTPRRRQSRYLLNVSRRASSGRRAVSPSPADSYRERLERQQHLSCLLLIARPDHQHASRIAAGPAHGTHNNSLPARAGFAPQRIPNVLPEDCGSEKPIEPALRITIARERTDRTTRILLKATLFRSWHRHGGAIDVAVYPFHVRAC